MGNAHDGLIDKKEGKIGGGDDPLSLYIKEIQKYPLLTEEEEKELARRARQGDREARDKLIKSNLRFVVSIAKSYADLGISLLDLINEGNMGLIKAAERYDERKGVRFLSYAVWWIRQAILKAITEQIKSYRIPMSRAGHVVKVAKAESRISQRTGREPTVEELAKELGLKVKDVVEAMSIAKHDISLDATVKDYESLSYLDLVSFSASAPSPEEIYFRKKFLEDIKIGIEKLTDREKKIIRMYFGIDGERPHTLEEIGEIMGLSRERVRQIRNRAIEKLREYASLTETEDTSGSS